MVNVNLDEMFKLNAGGAIFVLDSSEEGGLVGRAEELRFRVFRINGERTITKDTLLSAFADVFSFPDYFGHNWDALDECLRDLTWLERVNFILVFEKADKLLALGPQDFSTLIGILSRATFSWRAECVTFSVILLGGTEASAAVEAALVKD